MPRVAAKATSKSVDLKLALKKSKDFYVQAGLNSWVKELPSKVEVPKEHHHLLKKAQDLGLDHCMVFPRFQTQVKSIPRLVKQTVIKPVEGIPEHLEYAGPYVSHNWSKKPSGRVHQAEESIHEREGGPYLLFHNILDIPAKTRGKKATQIAKLFEKEKWNGFTAPEFLACLRRWREKLVEDGVAVTKMDFKDYRWVWLVDSMDQENCAVAYFGPQVVGLYGCKVGSANKLRGANVTVVVPLH